MAQKLKALKDTVKRWNKEECGVEGHKTLCFEKIEKLDLNEQLTALSTDEKMERRFEKRWVKMVEISWRKNRASHG